MHLEVDDQACSAFEIQDIAVVDPDWEAIGLRGRGRSCSMASRNSSRW